MKTYLIKMVLAAAALCLVHALVLLYVRAPIVAEYWVRELIELKRYMAAKVNRPKIIVLGGSNVLFGIDANSIEKAMGNPAINFGLHGGMRLEDLLAEGASAAKPGDTIVLLLEPIFFEDDQSTWTEWQLVNALAWNRSSIDELPLRKKVAVFFQASNVDLSLQLLSTALGQRLFPGHYEQREQTLAPAQVIAERYLSGKFRDESRVYCAYNLDDHGDFGELKGAFCSSSGISVARPSHIAPSAKVALSRFVSLMRARHVRVAFGYSPYLIDGVDTRNWKASESVFRSDIDEIGAQVIEQRDAVFFRREYFYNGVFHLNSEGRKIRTERLIDALRRIE